MYEIEQLVQQMTLDEKAALCTGASAWTTTPVERLGIPALTMTDGPHGVRHTRGVPGLGESAPATCFPTGSCLAATWNTDLIREVGQAIATEAISMGVGVVLGPAVNMKRTPLCGRNFEYYAEDPCLAGEMAAAFIDGVQSRGVGTSLKHFAANNQEAERSRISALIDERSLRELYLAAFETAVKKGRPWTVMCAYNKINGTYCSEHHELLSDILKHEWDFDGPVISDWGAVHSQVKALQAGLDLEMPGPQHHNVKSVIDAVKSGALAESILDESVRRILKIVLKSAAIPKGAAFDPHAHHALARRVAGEGIVLLKNNGLLPLAPMNRLAIIGRSAKVAHFQGGGSSHIHATQVDNPLDEVRQLAGAAHMTYCDGYPDNPGFRPELIDEAVAAAGAADVALLFVALPGFVESEGYDRPNIDLTPQQVALIKAVCEAQPRSVVILNNGSSLAMSEWIDGAAAVIEAWMMGQAGAGAIADVLFGKLNPSGKLSETFPLRLADTPAFLNYPGDNGQVNYGEGLYIGYRYYDARNLPVLFPFGFGLSYTTFAYSKLTISATSFRDVDGLDVSVNVTNSGDVAGKEVVQFYVQDHKSRLARPPKELKAFAKVELQPGETKTVSVHLDLRAFAFYHPAYKKWITENGEVSILVGASAADIRCSQVATLHSTTDLPCVLNMESTIREWLEDVRGRPVLQPVYERLKADVASTIGSAETSGMEIESFLLDLPPVGILSMQNIPDAPPAEALVAQMLQQAHGAEDY